MASGVKDASAVAEFIRTRRWFRSKTRNIEKAEIQDVITTSSRAQILIVKITYGEGDCDNYVLTDTGDNQDEPVEALDNGEFRALLLDSFLTSATFPGHAGEFVFSRTSALHGSVDVRKLPSSVSRAEQSNSSIIFGDQFILKLFRKIEAGTNPDIEIGAFLTQQGFTHTPAVLGTLEYRSQRNHAYSAGILQQFVRNEGDAWKYTLESLGGFFDRVADLDSKESVRHSTELVGDYLHSAELLGQRTAEMHIALASGSGNPDFEPEPFTPEAARNLHEEMLAQADIAFETLRRKQATLSGHAAQAAHELLHLENRVTERFAALRDHVIPAARIRIHGDYHLGQVLWTGSDFMIIDFEGEPARPLEERRSKSLAMRDVAGMLRSFQYAAYAALFARGSNIENLVGWADTWHSWVSAAFLRSYLRSAQGSVFLPPESTEQRMLLDAFLLHKALYEVAYEMNNRPDWVRIPLQGILSLVA